jgi:hypothetical protein
MAKVCVWCCPFQKKFSIFERNKHLKILLFLNRDFIFIVFFKLILKGFAG